MAGKKHLKRLAAPKIITIPRKTHVWTVKPGPGPHGKDNSVPLLLVLRDYVKLADTGSEARRIIGSGAIHVDGKPARDYKRPVGFMDVLSIPDIGRHFRILFSQTGQISVTEIPAKNAGWKLCRIENKTIVKGGDIQLNLHDGRNMIVHRRIYKTGEVLKIKLPSGESSAMKIVESFSLQEGNVAMIIGGKHRGQIATIDRIEVTRSSKPNIIHFKEGFSTIKDYAFVVGSKIPEVSLPEVSAI